VTTTGDQSQQDGSGPLRSLGDLPEPVRRRIVQWAADAVGAAPAESIPASLSRVARFAPAKRARTGATALAHAIRTDAAFRSLVAERAAGESGPAADGDPRGGSDGDPGGDLAGYPGPDPVTAAARAYLLRLPDESELIAAVAARETETDARATILALQRQVQGLTDRLERVTADLAAARAPVGAEAAPGEVERLRLRLREQGARIRELQQQVDQARSAAAAEVRSSAAERDRAVAEAESWRERAEAATARADAAAKVVERQRRATGERRAASDRRLELLLGALEGAAVGLRREWDLQGGGPAPADVVAAGLPMPPAETGRTVDPSRLAAWAGLPGAHLIVDGYNVTKTGFGELSLSEQRDRLVRGLGALAARTSAEVTVVFDGAAVAAARPPARGVRVLFSPPGVLADHVINDLVRAEPAGRVVVVVTSDREVADRAAADGARTAASSALLAALG
jgi:hypothetical protein